MTDYKGFALMIIPRDYKAFGRKRLGASATTGPITIYALGPFRLVRYKNLKPWRDLDRPVYTTAPAIEESAASESVPYTGEIVKIAQGPTGPQGTPIKAKKASKPKAKKAKKPSKPKVAAVATEASATETPAAVAPNSAAKVGGQ